ncbi:MULTISPECIES: TetR/AcrR family transcriptional regulator [unclassified Novosphingobium]|uniref:TetR/AcrR family transcriptional regulator n=1 Tax=unclassified Novosphingobium TaxID=2644732 RepID=UPI0014470894|nr:MULTISPECIES: TetR/AcrR family transcriptional regulator [unclassified Novosphingobium]NKJ41623.1 AcrR family transcriptional regulator [Novosphingobium sp. SG720]NMN86003.1 AcrR family transcriptional regulator [Novosphingobium sp. SG916]
MPEPSPPPRQVPRKLPRQARAVETVAAIVEAAARILEQGGIAALTTNAVAARAGVSVGSLYQYFPGKEALVGALIVRETSILIAECEEALARVSGQEALVRMIGAAVAHQLRRPKLARLLDVEEARMPHDPETQRVSRHLHGILRTVLIQTDLGTQSDLDEAAHDVMAIVKGMIDAAGERQEQDQAALAGRVWRAVHGYLATAAPPVAVIPMADA